MAGNGEVRSGHYSYLPQDRVIFGRPAAEAVAEEAERLGARRVMVAASRSLAENAAVVRETVAALGARHAGTFTGCREHTPRETVIDAANAVREAGADLIVSMGGGTVIDTVKVLQLVLAADIRDAAGMDAVRLAVKDGKAVLPDLASPVRQIAVPTTLSGAEFSNLGAATDTSRGAKEPFMGRDVNPRAVILDPEATRATPEWLWLSTGIRAVDHAVETICGIDANAYCDGLSLHALRLLAAGLRRTKEAPEDMEARLACQQAAWMAASSIMRVQYGASHGIGHALGGVTGMAHGITSCVMLPHVMRHNLPVTGPQQASIAEAMGAPGGGGAAADTVGALIADLGLPTTLRAAGVERGQLPKVAEIALANLWVRTNPRPFADAGEILALLEAAYG